MEETLIQYGQPSDQPALPWDWVDAQLADAGTYWTSVVCAGTPHPRPVWGVWIDELLHLSIGSPRLAALAQTGASTAVHLESGTDVVILEGTVVGSSDDAAAVAAYDSKYAWAYDVAESGPLTSIRPKVVLAWRAAGWAGSDGFTTTGRWRWG